MTQIRLTPGQTLYTAYFQHDGTVLIWPERVISVGPVQIRTQTAGGSKNHRRAQDIGRSVFLTPRDAVRALHEDAARTLARAEANLRGSLAWLAAEPQEIPFMLIAEGRRTKYETVAEAHTALREYAAAHDLDVHEHPGGWDGDAISTAYDRGGDMLADARAVVRPSRLD